jgi:hypothetical protein
MIKVLVPFFITVIAAGAYPNIGWDSSDLGTSIDPNSVQPDISSF